MKKADDFMLTSPTPHLQGGVVIKPVVSKAVFLDSNPGSALHHLCDCDLSVFHYLTFLGLSFLICRMEMATTSLELS